MKKTDVSNVKSWDTSQDTALTSDVLNAISMYISLWISLTKYLFGNTSDTSPGTQKSLHKIELKAPLRRLEKKGPL